MCERVFGPKPRPLAKQVGGLGGLTTQQDRSAQATQRPGGSGASRRRRRRRSGPPPRDDSRPSTRDPDRRSPRSRRDARPAPVGAGRSPCRSSPKIASEVASLVTLVTGDGSTSAVAASRSSTSSRRAGPPPCGRPCRRRRFLHGSGSAALATATRRSAPAGSCSTDPAQDRPLIEGARKFRGAPDSRQQPSGRRGVERIDVDAVARNAAA